MRKLPFPLSTDRVAETYDHLDTSLENQPHLEVVEPEKVMALVRPIIEPLVKEIERTNHDLRILVNDIFKSRVFDDTPVQISANVAYEVNYQERRFLYLNPLGQTITFTLSTGNTIIATINNWTPISFPKGTKITAAAFPDSSPATVIIRACDYPIAMFAELLNGVSSIGSVTVNNTDPNSGATGLGSFALVRTVLNLANAARATFSQQFGVGDLKELKCLFNLQSFTGGTTPTATFKVSSVGADGTVAQLEQGAASGTAIVFDYSIGAGLDGKAFGNTIQVDMVVTGAPTSVTFSASIIGK